MEGMGGTDLVYKKLTPDCKVSIEPVNQADCDLTVQFIKKCFPKAKKLQKDMEQTLKRTFVLRSKEKKRKYFDKKKMEEKKLTTNRKFRLRKERIVPGVLNYDTFVQLNGMWNAYIADLLQDEHRPEEIQQRLNRIDLHGAHLTVVKAHCKDYLGLEGIVVKESKNMFIIVTKSGATKSVPKAENFFQVDLSQPKGTLKICGNSFLTRPAERASKKIKSFMEYVGVRTYKSKLKYTCPR